MDLFGAVALNLHGLARSTEDLDIFVAPEPANIGERAPYQDLTVTVITPRMLYKMKKNTVRLKDRADADLVRRHFNLEQD